MTLQPKVLFCDLRCGIKHWGPQPQDLRFTGHAALHRNTVITDDCKPSSITALDLRSSRPQMRPHRPAHVTASIKRLSGGGRGYPGRAPVRRKTVQPSQRCRSSCPTFQCQPWHSLYRKTGTAGRLSDPGNTAAYFHAKQRNTLLV